MFRRWIDILFQNPESCVINAGNFSSFFELHRGCQQGDPISPYIFILAVEPLAVAIKNSNEIKGINISNSTYKIGQFADDTFVLLDGTEKSLQTTLDLLEKFHNCSGIMIKEAPYP